MTTISDDKFIETIVSSANREVHELAEEHIIFPGPDPQVLIPVKQWLVMELFDFLRLSWQLEDIGIAFRRLSPAPNWSQDPKTGELLHEGSSTGIIANDSSQVAANLPWFLKHSPKRLLEITHIESTKEACQALFGIPRVPFAKRTDTRQ